MLMRLLSAGLLAGVITGACVAVIQEFTTTPLILAAEVYEKAAETHHHATVHPAAHANIVLVHNVTGEAATGDHEAKANEWEPEDGLQRTLFTSTATVGAATGFAMMLLAVMLLSNAKISLETGALWGAAGFAATGLAPGLGLAPELPGSVSADLFDRQVWWLLTAACTAIGFFVIWRRRSLGPVIGGAALIAAPHVWGAPHPEQFGSTVPAELASRFTSSSLAIQAILWVLAGALAGYFWVRQAPSAEASR